MKYLGLELVPIGDASTVGGGLTYCATALVPPLTLTDQKMETTALPAGMKFLSLGQIFAVAVYTRAAEGACRDLGEWDWFLTKEGLTETLSLSLHHVNTY